MKFQLVLQFDENVFSYNDMISFEDKLEKKLKGIADADVDGHDIGSGEINFFIFTNNPKDVFNMLQPEIINISLQKHLRAAFRKVQNEVFTILWPKNLNHFKIK